MLCITIGKAVQYPASRTSDALIALLLAGKTCARRAAESLSGFARLDTQIRYHITRVGIATAASSTETR